MNSKGVAKNLKVLIVDDYHNDAVFVRELLQSELYEYSLTIDFSFTYMEAIYNIVNNQYDFCIFDYELGDMKGLDLVESVRGRGFTMPIIFLAKDFDKENILEINHAGADAVFVKSELDPQELSSYIIKTLKGDRSIVRRSSKFIQDDSRSNVSSIICELDRSGKILFINQGSYKLTGYRPTEIIGKKWSEVFGKSLNAEQKKILKPHEKLIKTKRGQIKILEINKRKLLNETGKLERVVLNATDISHKIFLRQR